MLRCFIVKSEQKAIPIHVMVEQQYSQWVEKQPAEVKNWLSGMGFQAKANEACVIPSRDGKLSQVIYVIDRIENFWSIGALPLVLPEGIYRFENNLYHEKYALGWGLGAYQFDRYKKCKRKPAVLNLPADNPALMNTLQAIYMVRDLINIPTDDMGPSEFAEFTNQIANQHQAKLKQIVGEALLAENYAAIYTVGRASDDEPRLLDLTWGNPTHPKITLVGKGVCFDSGGLDIKPAPYMLLMKKDMGGAAHVLGLAKMIMTAALPVRLRVLMPVVENVISGNAYRPGDVITSRSGKTIEIGNTDAEGRVILADALTAAVADKPDLLVDIATLTGAARVAVGTDIAAYFSNQDELAQVLQSESETELDPMWRLPLYAPYRDYLASTIADLNNNPIEPYAGAITAALFLKEFVPNHIPWLHFDIMAWNLKTRPGHPQGAEAMGIRALMRYLEKKFNAK